MMMNRIPGRPDSIWDLSEVFGIDVWMGTSFYVTYISSINDRVKLMFQIHCVLSFQRYDLFEMGIAERTKVT